jgi:hypothetical protein
MYSIGTKKPVVIAVSALMAALTWFALALQFYLSWAIYMAQGRTVAGALTEFFTYFTIQCNIITATGLTAVALGGFSKSFFSRPGVLTASAVYISIVCLVYNIALRGIVHPEGWARVADELLHAVCPPLFVIFWLTLVRKRGIVWKHAFSWLWYPFFYLVYALTRGALCGRYPYFFLNVVEYGYPRVFINIAILMLVFLGLSILYAFIAKLMSEKVAA